ncbi:SCP2 sterol-binding domain-containing protein [Bacillus swezeyi]|uniref:SCP2 domain-containing protein n=1 Tax=Bacillus swezeyi TaxID=1925020 RepID=A0A1R1RZV3_9BACI|nr:SCP2 sterol-binding domain-containing protein [Bacillus swezeyi]KAA6450572.1 hypothetical protein DX927_06815 [Bacillus swezeyi]KAA6475252.1 hypothetical protein DX928_14800 [Bacillus swezeyi]MEC1259698.1 SCP2 sterol-binding domain-containing protein [Bacillus swezeyi]MED1739446.1 SCP2 sterol-binding domain-containing protein [Bacillus swezeyi]MED2927339.1 SCP2 sterol-binding domain-containing protein [Bacillus swezeyi]
MEKIGLIEREDRSLFLKPLLSTTALLITFQGEKEAFTLAINEQGEMEKSAIPKNAHLTFFGEQSEIIDLLHGDISLQQLVQRGTVKVKGSFRALLKLEAILWLTDGFFKNSDLHL